MLKRSKNVTRQVYDILIWDLSTIEKYAKRWIADPYFCNLNLEMYRSAFDSIFKVTKITKLRDFQYRLLLGKIVTNEQLFTWKMIETPNCTFGCNLVENQTHLLNECIYVQPLWEYVTKLCNEYNIFIDINDYTILYNLIHENVRHVINLIALLLKRYVYTVKCGQRRPNVHELIAIIDYNHDMSLFNSKREHNLGKHIKLWSPIKPFLTNMYMIPQYMS